MVHTSESLKAKDTTDENWHYQMLDGDQYRLSEGELQWLDFIRGKYCIADHLDANIVDGVYTVDLDGMSQALRDDDMPPKAVMLADDTALQAIFFYSYIDDDGIVPG